LVRSHKPVSEKSLVVLQKCSIRPDSHEVKIWHSSSFCYTFSKDNAVCKAPHFTGLRNINMFNFCKVNIQDFPAVSGSARILILLVCMFVVSWLPSVGPANLALSLTRDLCRRVPQKLAWEASTSRTTTETSSFLLRTLLTKFNWHQLSHRELHCIIDVNHCVYTGFFTPDYKLSANCSLLLK